MIKAGYTELMLTSKVSFLDGGRYLELPFFSAFSCIAIMLNITASAK